MIQLKQAIILLQMTDMAVRKLRNRNILLVNGPPNGTHWWMLPDATIFAAIKKQFKKYILRFNCMNGRGLKKFEIFKVFVQASKKVSRHLGALFDGGVRRIGLKGNNFKQFFDEVGHLKFVPSLFTKSQVVNDCTRLIQYFSQSNNASIKPIMPIFDTLMNLEEDFEGYKSYSEPPHDLEVDSITNCFHVYSFSCRFFTNFHAVRTSISKVTVSKVRKFYIQQRRYK